MLIFRGMRVEEGSDFPVQIFETASNEAHRFRLLRVAGNGR